MAQIAEAGKGDDILEAYWWLLGETKLRSIGLRPAPKWARLPPGGSGCQPRRRRWAVGPGLEVLLLLHQRGRHLVHVRVEEGRSVGVNPELAPVQAFWVVLAFLVEGDHGARKVESVVVDVQNDLDVVHVRHVLRVVRVRGPRQRSHHDRRVVGLDPDFDALDGLLE